MFEQYEREELFHTRTNLNQIGNLIKQVRDKKIPFDNELLVNAQEVVFDLSNQVTHLLKISRERTLKGAIKNAKNTSNLDVPY